MRKILKSLICMVLVLALFSGCTVVNVAKAGYVNGEGISLSTYKYALNMAGMFFGAIDYEKEITGIAMYDSYLSSYLYNAISDVLSEAGASEDGENLWDKVINEETKETVGEKLKKSVFDALAELEIMAFKAEEKGIALTAEEKAQISESKTSFMELFGSKTKFENALKSINMTSKELTELWESIVLLSKYQTELSQENEITDEEIKTFYKDNYVRVKHILIKVGDDGINDMEQAKAKATEVIQAIDSGADFEGLMVAYSGDKDTEGNINGGNTGYIFKKGDFGNPSFENASFALNDGEYTKEAIEVNGANYKGYHIIKRYALEDSYFDNNTDGIKDTVKTAINYEKYLAELEIFINEADITVNEGKIKRIKLAKIETQEEVNEAE